MNQQFFTANRQKFCEQLKPGSIVALTAFTAIQQTNDGAAPFVQEGNFWYLTGISEPDWRLIIDVDSGEQWLVAPQRSFVHKMFDGGLTPDDASTISGVKNVLSQREGAALLKQLLARKQHAYTLAPASLRMYDMAPNPAQRRLLATLKTATVHDARPILAKMRAVKQPAEIAAIQKAVNITTIGLQQLLPQLKNMHHEYEADAVLTYQFRSRGATHAFEPIIAAGKNACVLHHPLPKDPITPHNWLLIDIGAKIDGYCADVTRTVPIGHPSARHRQVYEAVQRIHGYTFSLIKAGASSKEFLHSAYQCVGQELQQLGLIKTIKLDYSSVFKYMPHAISHGLGIDAHDPLGAPETLQENMVITVEAGIYIPQEGIGVRLEDDALVTKDGAKNMSGAVPIALEHVQKMLY